MRFRVGSLVKLNSHNSDIRSWKSSLEISYFVGRVVSYRSQPYARYEVKPVRVNAGASINVVDTIFFLQDHLELVDSLFVIHRRQPPKGR